jgi:hypothetical protein
MQNIMSMKDSGGKEIIIEIGLAVIGVALLIVYRNQIATLVKNLMANITSKINKMFDDATNVTEVVS